MVSICEVYGHSCSLVEILLFSTCGHECPTVSMDKENEVYRERRRGVIELIAASADLLEGLKEIRDDIQRILDELNMIGKSISEIRKYDR